MKLCYSNIGFDKQDDEKVYDMLCNKGFEGLEIAPTRIFAENPYHADNLPKAEEFAQKLKKQYNLTVASMQSIWYGKTQSIFGGLEDKTELFNYTVKAYEFANAIGCKNLVFGCPKNRNMPRGKNKQEFEDFLVRIAAKAKKYNCNLALEPNPPIYNTNIINTTNHAANLIERLEMPALCLNLDFGTIIENQENLSYVHEFIPYLSHVHISEPTLKPIEKRKMHSELAQILADNNYQNYISIETACQDIQVVEKQMDYLKEVFN